MSTTVGPVAVPAAGAVGVQVPANAPGIVSQLVLANATPFVMLVPTGADQHVVQPFTADLVDVAGLPAQLQLQAEQAPGGPAATTWRSFVTITFYSHAERVSSNGYPLPLGGTLLAMTAH